MVNTRFSQDDDDLLDSTDFRNSHLTSTDSNSNNTTPYNNMFHSRSSRTNTLFSSPLTDVEERSRSDSVPISPLHNLDPRECVELAQMELELQFKTLEMLALIKGTTPEQALEAERLQDEIRSLRGRSTDVDELESVNPYDNDEDDISCPAMKRLRSFEAEKDSTGEYLVGDSYLDDEDQLIDLEQLKITNDSDGEDEDIFGMEL